MKAEALLEKTTTFKDFTLYYYTQGIPTNPTILLLHPAFADHRIFVKQLEPFSQSHYVIAVDMVGHGKSQNFNSSVNMGDMPEIIESILVLEKCKQVHLLGVSLGSLIAQGFAFKFPHRISSVTIIGGYSIHKNYEELLKKQKSEIGKWLFYLIFSLRKFKKYIIQNSSYSKESADVFEKCFETFKRRQFRAMSNLGKLFIKTTHPVFYPLLIVNGEHDLPIILKHNELLTHLEPSSRLKTIPHAGHCANIDNAEYFNMIYLKEVSQDAYVKKSVITDSILERGFDKV
jgi:3-oxoadipate enol-lactonase